MHQFHALLVISIAVSSEIEAFVSTNQTTFDIFGEDFHYDYAEDYDEDLQRFNRKDKKELVHLHAPEDDYFSSYEEIIGQTNDSLLDYGNIKRGKRDVNKFRGFRYGIELTCDNSEECQDWVNQQHFCVLGRCIQLFCEGDSDCPDESQCHDGQCIVVKNCDSNEDCQEGLVCKDGKCSPDDTECRDDEDCPPGLTCEDGKCEDEICSKDRDCKNGMVCLFGLCADGECRKNSDCSTGRICKNRRCFIQCSQVHGSCPPGLICQDNTCIQGKCKEDSDCGSPAACNAGYCSLDCLRDDDCPKGLICKNSRCTTCKKNKDCSQPGSRCKNGKCTDRECDSQKDCAQYEACVNGKCRKESCQENADCLNGDVCRLGLCQPCVHTQDCLNGEICENRRCIPDDKQVCDTSLDCKRDHCCIAGQCLKSCSRSSQDCSEETECMRGFCRPFCRRNRDCKRGSCQRNVCMAVQPREIADTTCEATSEPSGCQDDEDCYFGQYCDSDDGQCKYQSCRRHRGCSGRQKCRGRECIPVCNRRKKCRRGHTCHKHRCYKRCQADDDCPSFQFTCNRGRCLRLDDDCIADDCRRRQFCQNSQCIRRCSKPSDCPRRMNCIDGGCRNYRCFERQDCTGRRTTCDRIGRCQGRRPNPPWGGPGGGGGLTVISTHTTNQFGGSKLQDGFKLVRGNGPTNIPQNIPCPFYTRQSDQFGPIKCQRILCRCSTALDCVPYKPRWANGPMSCCAGACVLGPPDNCPRDQRVCK